MLLIISIFNEGVPHQLESVRTLRLVLNEASLVDEINEVFRPFLVFVLQARGLLILHGLNNALEGHATIGGVPFG